MVTPVHRFQTIDEQFRRPHQQSVSHPRVVNHNQSSQLQTSVIGNEILNESTAPVPILQPQLDAPVYLDPPLEGGLDTVPHAQLMRLGGLTKYGMWASFGLTTVSVAATKFYVDHQGTFEILLLCTLGVLSAGLLVSCMLTVCSKRNPPPPFINASFAPQLSQPTAIEMDVQEVMSQREIIIAPLATSISQQSTMEAGLPAPEAETPPPPYDIAVLLPVKDHARADYPPPTYENAVRFPRRFAKTVTAVGIIK